MRSSNTETGKEYAFDAYCKKVLRNEARDQYAKIKRRREHETVFSELSASELGQLYTFDTYFEEFFLFEIDETTAAIITDRNLATALYSLDEQKRQIVILSYFLQLSDREIGERIDLRRGTVQYQRSRALAQLRKKLLEMEDANSFE